MRPKQALMLLKKAASSWSDDRAPSMGAAISYYSLFSMAPLLVIIIAVAGLVFGADAVQGALFAQISDLMGEDAARVGLAEEGDGGNEAISQNCSSAAAEELQIGVPKRSSSRQPYLQGRGPMAMLPASRR